MDQIDGSNHILPTLESSPTYWPISSRFLVPQFLTTLLLSGCVLDHPSFPFLSINFPLEQRWASWTTPFFPLSISHPFLMGSSRLLIWDLVVQQYYGGIMDASDSYPRHKFEGMPSHIFTVKRHAKPYTSAKSYIYVEKSYISWYELSYLEPHWYW